ncbi:hypothetical protein F511_39857 [Dorcoceras hygrometricum]|uniref:Uncharacterized protein n=1 Tax=Dorcoceras hygrometricum TaxID=472368 RepID=A0A2Z7AAI4_9LAMI|nr:hypothetical protein F511_39857 [Dorcoceras hygrometricum]
MSASGESSTAMHRLLHASGSHPIPTPYDPKLVGKRVKRCVFCHEKKSKRCVLVKAVRIRESWIVRSVQRERSADPATSFRVLALRSVLRFTRVLALGFVLVKRCRFGLERCVERWDLVVLIRSRFD